MIQSASCPNCGSPISEQQQFCGICGAKLTGFIQPQPGICPGCGSPVLEQQQFCGVCGTNLSAGGIQQPVEFQTQTVPPVSPKISPAFVAGTPSATESASAEDSSQVPSEEAVPTLDRRRTIKEPLPSRTMDMMAPARSYLLLRIAAVIFTIFGWIILVGGCLGSIAMAVFAGIGGKFVTAIPGFTSLEGMAAIIVAIGGIIASVLYGFGFLAFSEICREIIAISRNTR